MFTQTWKKYMPVIAIMLKRSATGPQTLHLNHTDFERATGGRKVKFAFAPVKMNNARPESLQKPHPVAGDLLIVLQENLPTKKILEKQRFEFSMTSGFQLSITNLSMEEASADIDTDVKTDDDTKTIESDDHSNESVTEVSSVASE